MRLLAFDIGNTNVVMGAFDGARLAAQFRIKTDARRTLDEYAVLLKAFLGERFGSGAQWDQAAISSVVPPTASEIG